MSQALAKLVVEKEISAQQAIYHCTDKEQLINLIGLKELVQKPILA